MRGFAEFIKNLTGKDATPEQIAEGEAAAVSDLAAGLTPPDATASTTPGAEAQPESASASDPVPVPTFDVETQESDAAYKGCGDVFGVVAGENRDARLA